VLGLFKKSVTRSLNSKEGCDITSELRLREVVLSRERVLPPSATESDIGLLVAGLLSDFAGDMHKSGVDLGLYRLLVVLVDKGLAPSVDSSRNRRRLPGCLEELGLVSTPSARLPTKAVCFVLICGKNGFEISLLLPCTARGEILTAARSCLSCTCLGSVRFFPIVVLGRRIRECCIPLRESFKCIISACIFTRF